VVTGVGASLWQSDDALIVDYPTLTPADLDAAWEYYRRNPVEIEQSIWLNTTVADHPPGSPSPTWRSDPGAIVGPVR